MELRKVSQIKERVLGILNSFQTLPVSGDAKVYAEELRNHVEKENFLVAVVATWNTGKSTFINALQGEPLLPSQNKETTHIINRLRYSSRRYVIIHFRKNSSISTDRVKTIIQALGLLVKERDDNSIIVQCSRYQDQRALLEIFSTDDGYLEKYAGTYKTVFPEELVIPFPDYDDIVAQYHAIISKSDSQADEKTFERWTQLSAHFKLRCLRKIQQDIVEIELGIPLPLLKHGVQMLDTPGAVSFEEMRDDILENYIKFAQCVVFIFRFDQPGATEDIEFRRIVQECGIEDVFLVLNRIDCAQSIDEQWDAVAQIRQNLHQFVHGQIFLYPVSALGALVAKLKPHSRKGKSNPFLEKYSRFVERNNDERLHEYLNGLQKFSEDIDNYLVNVDKFHKIMNAPLNFVESEIVALNNQFDHKYQESVQSIAYHKLERDEKRFSELWDEWSEEINHVINHMEEIIEGNNIEQPNEEQIWKIISNEGSISENYDSLIQCGFLSGFNAIFVHLMNSLREQCNVWINSNSSNTISIRTLEEFLSPVISKVLETATRVLNNMVKNYYRNAATLTEELNQKIQALVESFLPVSFTISLSHPLPFNSTQVPEIKIPLPSVWERLFRGGRRLLQRNEQKWLDEIRQKILEIISAVENQAKDFYHKEIDYHTQRLIHSLDKQLEGEIQTYKGTLAGTFDQDNIEGLQIRDMLKELQNMQERCKSFLNEITEIRKLLGRNR